MTESQGRQQSVMPTGQMVGEGADPDALTAAATNLVMQDIARSRDRQGCEGGLGNSRKLRAAVREVVAHNVRRWPTLRNPKKVTQ